MNILLLLLRLLLLRKKNVIVCNSPLPSYSHHPLQVILNNDHWTMWKSKQSLTFNINTLKNKLSSQHLRHHEIHQTVHQTSITISFELILRLQPADIIRKAGVCTFPNPDPTRGCLCVRSVVQNTHAHSCGDLPQTQSSDISGISAVPGSIQRQVSEVLHQWPQLCSQ